MEIIAEIRQHEYRQVIKDYYLNKDWTRRVAILALISLGLALLSIINYNYPYKGRMIYGFFTSYFMMLFIAAYVIPYVYNYYKSRLALKGIECRTDRWEFNISTTGISTNNQEFTKFYPWMAINKVLRKGNYVILKPISGSILLLPVRALEDEDADAFLAIIANCRNNSRMKNK
jgi:hypothetical protein